MALIRVEFHSDAIDIKALAQAVLDCDAAAVGEMVDQALEFKGLVGSAIEGVDGQIVEAVAKLLCDLVPEAIEQASQRA